MSCMHAGPQYAHLDAQQCNRLISDGMETLPVWPVCLALRIYMQSRACRQRRGVF